MAICSVLELSMDYLCLDKEPSVTAQPELQSEPVKAGGKRYLLIGLCIGLVAAILIGLLAMALTGKEQEPTQPHESEPSSTGTTAATAPDYTDMLSEIKVSDAKCENVGVDTWHISFAPSLQVPGMQVQIAVRDNLIDTTYYPETSKMGTSYVTDYTLPDHAYDYDFIALVTVGDVTVQLSLLHAESDDGRGVRWEETWKE